MRMAWASALRKDDVRSLALARPGDGRCVRRQAWCIADPGRPGMCRRNGKSAKKRRPGIPGRRVVRVACV
ncbi:hypothetical protein [Lysobacter gummosus]|uniref:hypothetical protein n=1 Tax=Lysobacter gummosus TaxID=262324 RepID=UPI00363E363C